MATRRIERWIELGLPENRRGWLLWGGLVLGLGLLSFSRYHLAHVMDGVTGETLSTFLDEMTAALGAGVLFFGIRALTRSAPLVAAEASPEASSTSLCWPCVPVYLVGLVVFSGLHTLSNWGLREALYRLTGLGDYDYGPMGTRLLMELPYDALAFVLMVTLVTVTDRLRAARERELRAVRLESSLARAELRSLRLQLQPHFLFNALNTISATMYGDPTAADRMVTHLADLLRASLRTAGAEAPDQISLAAELEILDAYLALMRARFRDRLEVEIAIAPEGGETERQVLLRSPVPPFLLQPLVENAVRHGGAERLGRGRIELIGTRSGDRLRLVVEDDGPPVAGEAWRRSPADGLGGLGLTATAERLQLLYGADHRFEAGPRLAGGWRVLIEVPLGAEVLGAQTREVAIVSPAPGGGDGGPVAESDRTPGGRPL